MGWSHFFHKPIYSNPCHFHLDPFDDLIIFGSRRDDDISIDGTAGFVKLRNGDDSFAATGYVETLKAGRGDDTITLEDGAGIVRLGRGDDTLYLSGEAKVNGGKGHDTVVLDQDIGRYDVLVKKNAIVLIDRFSGDEVKLRNVEVVEFADVTFDMADLRDTFSQELPTIKVGEGTQALTVNDPDPSISVIWDRAVQQLVIENPGPNGPTIASRAYAMMHTAMYDAWASYDDTAVRVSFDVDGNNLVLEALAGGGDAAKAKAMSYAAYSVLNELFPEQSDLIDTVMGEQLGYHLTDDGSAEAAVGLDAAADLLAQRATDGSNQAGGYSGSYTPTNANPSSIEDITAWTPEYVPIDPDDGSNGQALQSFLTPQWGDVESFALAENADGSTDHSDALPPPPQDFFVAEQAGASLDMDTQTITLAAPALVNGVAYAAGDVIPVSKDLIGVVINQGFIDQALEVIEYSATLTDEGKIIAEFWEDGGGTAFPPGTFMAFAQFVSARDNNTLDEDAQMFLAMSNAVMDAGIVTWNAKVEYDYVRPVRAIRELGELGLIGEWGTDHEGNEGYVIEAFGGIDPLTGVGLGTQTILATDFVTFQRPDADPSPPFAEYTSGHSAFSSAGAEVLMRFTGSDDFGGAVTFAPGSTQFESGVPLDEVTLAWDTFTQAADEAGESRLYGGIHFTEGDLNSRDLGRQVGGDAYDLAQKFINGTATDEDRPFFVEDAFMI
ncbi:MAG: DUF6851 domain-containing protein [Pseudomonadota bacterium]